MASDGFYKHVKGQGILYAADFVQGKDYELDRNWLATYSLPIDGWYWFESKAQAEIMFSTPLPVPSTAITKLAFRLRFTLQERAAIEIASLDDPSAAMPQRQLAAMLRASQADMASSSWIDLARSDTIEGVQVLETYGIIGPGRAAQILSLTIDPNEVP